MKHLPFLFGLGVLGWLGLPGGLTAQEEGQKWAVVVGIDQYDHNPDAALRGAVNDAWAVAAALVEGAGFPPKNVFVLTSDQREGEAAPAGPGIPSGPPLRANLLQCLSALAQPGLVGPEDTVVFYFSGHGALVENKGYLITQDTVPTRALYTETSLPLEALRDVMGKLPARVVLVLVDACRNDPLAGKATDNLLSDDLAREFVLRRKTTEQVRATFFACEKGQRSWESKRPLGGRVHGYFGYHVAEGLRGAAAQEGVITLHSLEVYLGRAVPATAMQEQREQRPFVDYGEIAAGAATRTILAAIGHGTLGLNSQPRAVVYLDGKKVGETPLQVKQVAVGEHRLRFVREGYEPVERTVRVEANRFHPVGVELKKQTEKP